MADETTNSQASSEVRARVRELIRALAPNQSAQLGSETRLEADLEFDSLALVELAVRLETEFELPALAEGDVADLDIQTVGDVEALIESLTREGRP
jgi:acyl carrier protein